MTDRTRKIQGGNVRKAFTFDDDNNPIDILSSFKETITSVGINRVPLGTAEGGSYDIDTGLLTLNLRLDEDAIADDSILSTKLDFTSGALETPGRAITIATNNEFSTVELPVVSTGFSTTPSSVDVPTESAISAYLTDVILVAIDVDLDTKLNWESIVRVAGEVGSAGTPVDSTETSNVKIATKQNTVVADDLTIAFTAGLQDALDDRPLISALDAKLDDTQIETNEGETRTQTTKVTSQEYVDARNHLTGVTTLAVELHSLGQTVHDTFGTSFALSGISSLAIGTVLTIRTNDADPDVKTVEVTGTSVFFLEGAVRTLINFTLLTGPVVDENDEGKQVLVTNAQQVPVHQLTQTGDITFGLSGDDLTIGVNIDPAISARIVGDGIEIVDGTTEYPSTSKTTADIATATTGLIPLWIAGTVYPIDSYVIRYFDGDADDTTNPVFSAMYKKVTAGGTSDPKTSPGNWEFSTNGPIALAADEDLLNSTSVPSLARAAADVVTAIAPKLTATEDAFNAKLTATEDEFNDKANLGDLPFRHTLASTTLAIVDTFDEANTGTIEFRDATDTNGQVFFHLDDVNTLNIAEGTVLDINDNRLTLGAPTISVDNIRAFGIEFTDLTVEPTEGTVFVSVFNTANYISNSSNVAVSTDDNGRGLVLTAAAAADVPTITIEGTGNNVSNFVEDSEGNFTVTLSDAAATGPFALYTIIGTPSTTLSVLKWTADNEFTWSEDAEGTGGGDGAAIPASGSGNNIIGTTVVDGNLTGVSLGTITTGGGGTGGSTVRVANTEYDLPNFVSGDQRGDVAFAAVSGATNTDPDDITATANLGSRVTNVVHDDSTDVVTITTTDGTGSQTDMDFTTNIVLTPASSAAWGGNGAPPGDLAANYVIAIDTAVTPAQFYSANQAGNGWSEINIEASQDVVFTTSGWTFTETPNRLRPQSAGGRIDGNGGSLEIEDVANNTTGTFGQFNELRSSAVSWGIAIPTLHDIQGIFQSAQSVASGPLMDNPSVTKQMLFPDGGTEDITVVILAAETDGLAPGRYFYSDASPTLSNQYIAYVLFPTS